MLRRAFEQHDPWLMIAGRAPAYDHLRADPVAAAMFAKAEAPAWTRAVRLQRLHRRAPWRRRSLGRPGLIRPDSGPRRRTREKPTAAAAPSRQCERREGERVGEGDRHRGGRVSRGEGEACWFGHECRAAGAVRRPRASDEALHELDDRGAETARLVAAAAAAPCRVVWLPASASGASAAATLTRTPPQCVTSRQSRTSRVRGSAMHGERPPAEERAVAVVEAGEDRGGHAAAASRSNSAVSALPS